MTPLEHTLADRLHALADAVPGVDPPLGRLITAGRRRRRARMAGWSAVAAAAATGIAMSAAALTPAAPAYAVEVQDDGSISVTANRVADPSEVNRRLRKVTGGRAVIVLERDRCPAGSQGIPVVTGRDVGPAARIQRLKMATVDGDARLRVKKETVPVGQILVLSPIAVPGSAEPVSWGLRLYRLPGPTCVARY